MLTCSLNFAGAARPALHYTSAAQPHAQGLAGCRFDLGRRVLPDIPVVGMKFVLVDARHADIY